MSVSFRTALLVLASLASSSVAPAQVVPASLTAKVSAPEHVKQAILPRGKTAPGARFRMREFNRRDAALRSGFLDRARERVTRKPRKIIGGRENGLLVAFVNVHARELGRAVRKRPRLVERDGLHVG